MPTAIPTVHAQGRQLPREYTCGSLKRDLLQTDIVRSISRESGFHSNPTGRYFEDDFRTAHMAGWVLMQSPNCAAKPLSD